MAELRCGGLLLLSTDIALTSALQASKLSVTVVESMEGLLKSANAHDADMIVLDATGQRCEWIGAQVKKICTVYAQAFLCVYGNEVGRNPLVRLAVSDNGGAMTSWLTGDVAAAANQVHASLQAAEGAARYTCPFCAKPGFSEDGLWVHCPLQHINRPKLSITCPICQLRSTPHFQAHLRNHHGPASRGEVSVEPESQELVVFASSMVVVQRPADKKILLVHESRGRGYWLPGGKLNAGEGLCEAAKREMIEETGINIDLLGVLKLDFFPLESISGPYVRLRCTFFARPSDPDEEIKSIPDVESAGATWVSRSDLEAGLKVRNTLPLMWMKYLEDGKPVFPLSIIDSP